MWVLKVKKSYNENDDVSVGVGVGVMCGAAKKSGGGSSASGRKLDDYAEESSDDDLEHSATPPSATFVRDASGHSEMVFDVELPAIDMGKDLPLFLGLEGESLLVIFWQLFCSGCRHFLDFFIF